MAQPPAYTRQEDFSDWQAANPGDHLPGADVDAEFDAIKTTLDAILANLALIQRDDGELANASVSSDQLASDISVGVSPPTITWAAGLVWTIGDTIVDSGKWYLCIVDHTSTSSLATDISGGKWSLIYDFTTLPSTTPSDNSVTTAKIVDGAVTAVKIASDAVTTAKILDANVTTAKIADANVTTVKLATDAVTTTKITDANVTTAKIADLNVTTGKLAANAVTAAKESLDDWSDIASAATTDLGSVASRNVRITGTTNISSFGTAAAGTVKRCKIGGSSLQLTYNATSMKLPGSANITVLQDDTFVAISRGSGNWEVASFQRGDGGPVTSNGIYGLVTVGTALTMNPYAVNTSASQAHGLGSAPIGLRVYLECITGENGWTSGNYIEMPVAGFSTAGVPAYTVWYDSTNLYIITHASVLPAIMHKTSRTPVALTAANWRLRVSGYIKSEAPN